MRTRLADNPDLVQLREMGKAHVAEIIPEQEWVEERAMRTWKRYMEGGNPVIFVAENARELLGYVGGRYIEYPFTTGFSIELDVIYVRPRYRGSRAAAQLMDTFISWARSQGPCSVKARMSQNIPDKVTKFLVSYGFKPEGFALTKEI